MSQRYPLAWPIGWTRTARRDRARARFGQRTTRTLGESTYSAFTELSVIVAVKRLQVELDRLGATDVVLSTNLALRLDGVPRSDQREPEDPGVAVYFKLLAQPRTLACDRWDKVAGNIAAIAAHIEAIRAVDRYGVGTLAQAFAGYAALPHSTETWWEVLGVSATCELWEVDEAFRTLAKRAHPDAGGADGEMARLTAARAAAKKALT